MNKFTKIISVMLAVVLVVMAIPFTTFAATKGDVDGNGVVTAIDARLVLQYVAGLKTEADFNNAAGADVNGKDGITAIDARMILQMVAGLIETPTEPEKPAEPDTPTTDAEKAEMAALFNAKSAEIAKGSYTWTRVCDYVEPLTATGVDVSLIQSTVDKFLGIGPATTGNKLNAGKNALIPMSLTGNDIKEIQQSNSEITLILNNPSDPTSGGTTPFSHVSNAIITKEDVENEIKTALPAAKLNSFYANYYDVVVTAYLDSRGNPDRLLITYKLSAKLEAQAKVVVADVNASGQGTVETKIEYKDFNY